MTPEEARIQEEYHKAHAIAYGALTIALIEADIITQTQYDRALAQATVIVDQEYAAKRDRIEADAPEEEE